jgi:hypothetical protein
MDEAQEARVYAQYKSLKKVSITANVAVGFMAFLAIVLWGFLMYLRYQDMEEMNCRGRIVTYAERLRDDRDSQGWDALVSSAEKDPNQDVKAIVQQMRIKITQLKGANDLRDDAFNLCSVDSNFQPPR